MYKAYKNYTDDTYVFYNDKVADGKMFTFYGNMIERHTICKFVPKNLYEVNFTNAVKDVVKKTLHKRDFHSAYKLVV